MDTPELDPQEENWDKSKPGHGVAGPILFPGAVAEKPADRYARLEMGPQGPEDDPYTADKKAFQKGGARDVTSVPVKGGRFVPDEPVKGKFVPDPEQPKGFMGEFKEAISTSSLQNNMFVTLHNMREERLGYQKEIKGSQEYKDAVDQIKKDVPDAISRESRINYWLSEKVDEKYKDARKDKPEEPNVGMWDMAKGFVNAALDHPGMVAGELAKGIVEDPELLIPFAWESSLAKYGAILGKIGKVAGRTADVGVQMAAMQAPISATQQTKERGEVDVEKTAKESAMAGAAGVVLHGMVKLGLGAVARDKGRVVSPQDEERVIQSVQKDVEQGKTPTEALISRLEEAGLPKEEAAALGVEVDKVSPKGGSLSVRDRTMLEQQALLGELKQQGISAEKSYFRDGEIDFATSEDKAKADAYLQEKQSVSEKAAKAFTSRAADKGKGEIDAQGNEGRPVLPEAKAQEGQGERSRDLPIEHGPKPEDRAQSKVQEEVVPPSVPVNIPDIRGEIGWAQEGGRMLRSVPTGMEAKGEGEVVGRTSWERKSDFWPNRPDKKFTEKMAYEALDKVESGEPLKPIERRFIKYARDTLEERARPGHEARLEQDLEREAIQAEQQAKHAPPRQSMKIFLGEKGSRTIEFPEEGDKYTFRLASTLQKMMGASDSQRKSLHATVQSLLPYVKNYLGLDTDQAAIKAAQDYRKLVIDHARSMPEGGREQVMSPGAQEAQNAIWKAQWKAKGNQSGRIDPLLLSIAGLTGLSGVGVYAITQDKSKAIAAATLAGLAPIAIRLASLAGRGVRAVFDKVHKEPFRADEPMRAYYAQQQMVTHAVDSWSRSTDALLAGVKDKEASRVKVRDWLQGHRDMELTPKEQAYANEIRKLLDHLGSQAQDAKVIRQLRDNYLTGLYQKPPFKSWGDILKDLSTDAAYKGNYTGLGRTSRFNLQKVIPDYRTAEKLHEEGKFPLIPITNDPVRIAAHYAMSVQKTMAVKHMIEALKKTPSDKFYESGRPVPVIVPMTTKETASRIVLANHVVGEKMGWSPEKIESQNRFQILNAPHDYVYVAHPSLEGLRVHADVADSMKMIFDTKPGGAIQHALYSTSMGAKGLFFTVSMFHPAALAVVAGTLALPRMRSLLMMPKYWREIQGARQMIHSSEGAPQVKVASEAGLKLFHGVEDMDPSFVDRSLNYIGDLAGRGTSKLGLGKAGAMPIKAMREVHKWFTNFLWNEVHPTLKLAAFNAEMKNKMAKDTKFDMKKGAQEIAQATNDLFGGINWFDLATTVPSNIGSKIAKGIFSPSGRRIQQMVLLSPDWNIAAGRAWYEGLKSVLPGIERKASDEMYRHYIAWSALTYLGAASALASAMTGKSIWDQADWTYVETGDGRKVQLNKHFMEMVHLWTNPQKFFLNKLNLLPKEAIDQFFGKEWVSYDQKKGVFGPPMDSTVAGRLAHAGKTFVPISIANLISDPIQGLGGFMGFPVYGSTYEKRDEETRKKAEGQGKSGDAAVKRAQQRRKRLQEEQERARAP